MKQFDPDADVLYIPNENRVVRLSTGRELLLMSGRTCRGCGGVPYWVAWDAKSKLVAFEREGGSVPIYGTADPAVRGVLERFSQVSSP